MSKLFSGTQGALQINTADIAANAIDGTLTKDALIADYSDVTITASDLIMYGDATDSNNTKRDTVQGILDLAGGGGFEFVSSTNASGASVEFESLSGNYDYRLQFRNVTCAADTQMIMQFGTGGTPTYATANYQTQYAVFEQSSAGYAGNDGSGQAHITLGNSMNGSTPRNGYVEVYDLANASVFTSLWGIMIAEQNGGVETMNIFGGYLETTQADNSIKLDETAGTTFNGGSIALFRRPNA